MSSTVVCSKPRSMKSWNAAATSASRIGGRVVATVRVRLRGSVMDAT